ncbi:hypothetical protein [Streptomyces sp. NRRL S-350]|uniref:hypothetical protein n=1 Tax=Streptomyces sp. NRRL S-350 TaxID=1463902 RepID=UPI0004C1347E|nr:hypothetical protein [Streptomyces sp. NRRL S-350]
MTRPSTLDHAAPPLPELPDGALDSAVTGAADALDATDGIPDLRDLLHYALAALDRDGYLTDRQNPDPDGRTERLLRHNGRLLDTYHRHRREITAVLKQAARWKRRALTTRDNVGHQARRAATAEAENARLRAAVAAVRALDQHPGETEDERDARHRQLDPGNYQYTRGMEDAQWDARHAIDTALKEN